MFYLRITELERALGCGVFSSSFPPSILFRTNSVQRQTSRISNLSFRDESSLAELISLCPAAALSLGKAECAEGRTEGQRAGLAEHGTRGIKRSFDSVKHSFFPGTNVALRALFLVEVFPLPLSCFSSNCSKNHLLVIPLSSVSQPC